MVEWIDGFLYGHWFGAVGSWICVATAIRIRRVFDVGQLVKSMVVWIEIFGCILLAAQYDGLFDLIRLEPAVYLPHFPILQQLV